MSGRMMGAITDDVIAHETRSVAVVTDLESVDPTFESSLAFRYRSLESLIASCERCL